MVLVQNWPFCHLFVLGNLGQENVFYDILEQNNAFVGCKSKKLKQKTKIDMFSKGIVLGFNPKLAIFPSCLFQAIQGRRIGFMIERKNTFVGFKNKELKKTKNGYVFKEVSPWFWSNIGHFSIFCFLGNLGQKNVFYHILERKSAFLCYKKRSLKSRKCEIFLKGLVHGFGPKLAIFPSSFFQAFQARKMCFMIFSREKNAFEGQKNKS